MSYVNYRGRRRRILPACGQGAKRRIPGDSGGWSPKATHMKQRGGTFSGHPEGRGMSEIS